MGIVNVTPDSFADGGARFDPDVAIADAMKMVDAGADLIDIGGESTRPGAPPLPADEELSARRPRLEGLRPARRFRSRSTPTRPQVAERALDLGATIVNDISALTYDPDLAAVVARRRAAVVLMHNRGRSAEMYAQATYQDVAAEIVRELRDRIVPRTRPASRARPSSSIPASASRSGPSTPSRRSPVCRRSPPWTGRSSAARRASRSCGRARRRAAARTALGHRGRRHRLGAARRAHRPRPRRGRDGAGGPRGRSDPGGSESSTFDV